MLPRPTIEAFDRHLLGLGLRFEGVVIGGSALGLMGVIQRPTRDVRHPCARATACDRLGGARLRDGTAQGRRRPARRLAQQRSDAAGRRPARWMARARGAHLRGTGPRAQHAGQVRPAQEQLFALCDRGTDLPDCIALAPTAEELAECVPWLEVQDGNELWPAHVRATVADLARRLGHGV